ncbi:MAG TPA: hypothetical protein VGC66_13780 [Pyrinomonadaceae bacterium]
MRASRRRERKIDPLAHPNAIRGILSQLRERLPDLVPSSEKHLLKMLNSVRNIQRRPATDTRRGRPSRWKRKDLLQVAGQLRTILNRESKGRVSLNSFIGLYVRALHFPKDVIKALVEGEITLFEAGQLARLDEDRLRISPAEARTLRGELLQAHQMSQGSQTRLQARVNDQLGLKGESAPSTISGKGLSTELVDELLELDPYDTRHLFWEELRRIAFTLREITPEDVDEKTLTEFLVVTDKLSGILARIQKRRLYRENRRR